MSFAAENIVDFDPAWVSAGKPAVFTCEVSNYKKIMKGKLLDQWADAFRQDTNGDLVIYVLVFLDDATTAGMWAIGDTSITFEPITNAFRELFFLSYIKLLFDPTFDGSPVQLPSDPGSRASAEVELVNLNVSDIKVVPAGVYTFNDTVKDWRLVVSADLQIPPDSALTANIYAATVGDDAVLTTGAVSQTITPSLPAEVQLVVTAVTAGTNSSSAPVAVPSKYFDLSLALAYQCKLDTALSFFWTQVKVALPVEQPDTNACWIRSKTAAQEKEAMLSLASGDRSKYYWGALYLMGCLNTWVVAHSEPVNILPLALAMWFSRRNAAGLYVGNKLHQIRLTGTRIKPFGVPSWISSDVNTNDTEGFAILDEKRVAYLSSISDNSVQDSALSSARGVTGLSMNAMMISKYIDYTLAQDLANVITDTGTLTNPVLTDQEAYELIQRMTLNKVSLFTDTKRIYNVRMAFPDFGTAKQGLTELVAATSWSALYKDDLDEVTITGGITEE
jgi:hypothetical protein